MLYRMLIGLICLVFVMAVPAMATVTGPEVLGIGWALADTGSGGYSGIHMYDMASDGTRSNATEVMMSTAGAYRYDVGALGDVDNNGTPDIVVATNIVGEGTYLYLYDIAPDGTRTNARDINFHFNDGRQIVATTGDLDNDGFNELVLGQSYVGGSQTYINMYDISTAGVKSNSVDLGYATYDARYISLAVGDVDNSNNDNELVIAVSGLPGGQAVVGFYDVDAQGTRSNYIDTGYTTYDGRKLAVGVGNVDNSDGDNELVIAANNLPNGQTMVFCYDVDSLGARSNFVDTGYTTWDSRFASPFVGSIVPEPTTCVLLLVSGGMILRRRRHQS